MLHRIITEVVPTKEFFTFRLLQKSWKIHRTRELEKDGNWLCDCCSHFYCLVFICNCFHDYEKERQRLAVAPRNARGVIVTFRHDEFKHATKNFSERLGGGNCGSVFKGVLPNRVVIAVKRLDGVRQGEKEFRAEVKSIGMIPWQPGTGTWPCSTFSYSRFWERPRSENGNIYVLTL
jgi:hypothetical protein